MNRSPILCPLPNDDPTKPDSKDGADNDSRDHMDFLVVEANRRRIYLGMLPTWGAKWNRTWGGGSGSAQSFHREEWLRFDMRQDGHVPEFTGRHEKTREDCDRTPIEPMLDGEPIHEDRPISFEAEELGHSTATGVRRRPAASVRLRLLPCPHPASPTSPDIARAPPRATMASLRWSSPPGAMEISSPAPSA